MERFDTLADAILESRPEAKEYDVYGYDSEFCGMFWLGKVYMVYEEFVLEPCVVDDDLCQITLAKPIAQEYNEEIQ